MAISLTADPTLPQGYLKINGTTAATITTSGVTGNLTGNVTGNLVAGGGMTLRTAVALSGNAVTYTAIPSWVKKISVMFEALATTGTTNTSIPLIRIGTGGNVAATGYKSIGSTATANSPNNTTGFVITYTTASTYSASGTIVIHVLSSADSPSYSYIASGNALLYTTSTGVGINSTVSAGAVTLSGLVDTLSFVNPVGTDTFTGGYMNISYEG